MQAPHAKIVYTPEYYASLKKKPEKKDDLAEVVNKWEEQFAGIEMDSRKESSKKEQWSK
jgi:hypothetical protein